MDKFDACMKGGFALNKSNSISQIWDHCYIGGEGLMYSIYGMWQCETLQIVSIHVTFTTNNL